MISTISMILLGRTWRLELPFRAPRTMALVTVWRLLLDGRFLLHYHDFLLFIGRQFGHPPNDSSPRVCPSNLQNGWPWVLIHNNTWDSNRTFLRWRMGRICQERDFMVRKAISAVANRLSFRTSSLSSGSFFKLERMAIHPKLRAFEDSLHVADGKRLSTDIPFKILVPLVVADHLAHPKPHYGEIFLGSLGTLGGCHNGIQLFFGFGHEILPLFAMVIGLQAMATQYQTILGKIWVR